MVPVVSSATYDAVRRRAAFIDRSDRGRIVVSGKDRASYLQGLLTNDVVALKAGQGCYAAYLTAQGRMISDLWVYEVGDLMLLTMSADVKDLVLAKLDQFIFSEDVQLGDVSATYAQIGVIGPRASSVVAAIVESVQEEVLDSMPDHGNLRSVTDGRPVIVTRIVDAGERGFDLYIEHEHAEPLMARLRQLDVAELDEQTADAIRIEGGVPRFHRDMDEETIPLEAGIESTAVSMTKGCYVGQEVIVRVLHRGHGRVVRKLVGLTFGSGAPVPAAGAVVRADARDVGHVTSVCLSPALQRPIALAYVHRDFIEPGTAVSVDQSTAEVTKLPFV
ncbi:MAG TPA: glycine cleavage T C-terminal barrel domain-containing protein [Vicinamibacterales bacterium]|jgi:folate-binding protein YgfZ